MADDSWAFVKFVKKRKPPVDHEREQALADERDTLAINRFLAVVLNTALPSNCSRVGSSQHAKRKGHKNGAARK